MDDFDRPISIREALEHPLILPSPISYTYGEILQDLAREHGIAMRIEMSEALRRS